MHFPDSEPRWKGADSLQFLKHAVELARDAGVWPAPRLTRDALVHLSRYPFPGNVRELENLLHRAVALSGAEELDVYDLGLPESVFTDSAAQELDQLGAAAELGGEPTRAVARMAPVEEPLPNDLAKYLDDVERDILVFAVGHAHHVAGLFVLPG